MSAGFPGQEARVVWWALLSACSSSNPEAPGPTELPPAPPSWTPPAPWAPPVLDLRCPAGMVWVGGSGQIGLPGQPYALVPTRHLEKVEAPERGCPAALAAHPEPLACWVQTDISDPVVGLRKVQLDPYCIDAWPFPGEGSPYLLDGMTAWDAELLHELLSTGRYGPRRVCTFTELQAAVAGLQSNQPLVYGRRHDPARCPEGKPIGADLRCRNEETGVREYGAIVSHWVRADAAFVAAACPSPPCLGAGQKPLQEGAWVVAGGTARLQTRQAPLTPHTWHDHGEPNPAGCDDMGHDDQPVICASPWTEAQAALAEAQEGERRWRELVEVARQSGRVGRMLDQGLGRETCPTPMGP